MWLYTENIAGSHVNLDIGRLDFEDERRWWWDDELDAVRVEYERETFDLALALAYELASESTDKDAVDPDQKDVLARDRRARLGLPPEPRARALRAAPERPLAEPKRSGDLVDFEREDDSDGRLTWLGARLRWASSSSARAGLLGYWLDTALVRGEEELLELEESPERPDKNVVEAITNQSVSGWGVDVGLSWILPFAYEPRIFARLRLRLR